MELTLLDSELPVMASALFFRVRELGKAALWKARQRQNNSVEEIHYWETEILSA